MPDTASRVTVDLTGVPETMLWPLWNRAGETKRPDRLLDDPMSADLVDRIAYDFTASFGKPSVFHGIRARVYDDFIRAYLQRTAGDPVVVGLGDGLETQLWRVDDDRVRWISVDLPEAIAVRKRLLPAHPRASAIEVSALDPAWLDAVPADPPPFICAAGLLMYFEESAVVALLKRIADRFPGAELAFDTIPPAMSRKTLRGMKITKHYTAPKMPWGISVDDIPTFLANIARFTEVRAQTYAEPFPERTRLYSFLGKFRAIRNLLAPALVHTRVAP